MRFNNFNWDNYRRTARGKGKIAEFSDLSELSDTEIIRQVESFNSSVFKMHTPEAFLNALSFFQYAYGDLLDVEITSIDEACDLYASLGEAEICEDDGEIVMPAGDYQFLLQANIALSYALSMAHPAYFFPNLYPLDFQEFVRLCDNYADIGVPEIPKKSDYRARYLYYADMCRSLYAFRIKNSLSSAELAAFLYDFAPATMQDEDKPKELPQPTAVWCIGGKDDTPSGLWQSSEETRRGDILLYYQKAPRSAITQILRADSDGLVDPFFHFYSRTFLCCPSLIPDITRSDLQADVHFSSHPLVKKNFQGVNGWPMKSDDYRRILEMLECRGFDTSQLPDLPTADFEPDHPIRVEKDVEEYLLNPFLKECGVTEEDYIRQMPLRMGRGDVKYPDYAVFASTEPGYEKAALLIEAKLEIRNNREREEAFRQARSYALRLESEFIILCDRNAVWIYYGADRVNYERYCWGEIRSADVFARMKRLFSVLRTRGIVQKSMKEHKK